MRAIGKGSLASLLAMGLHFTRIILWVAFIGLAIAMAVVPFATLISGAMDGGIGVSAEKYLNIAHHFVTFAVMLFVVNRLLEILQTLRFGSPFVKENADRFRGLGYALLIGEGAKIRFWLYVADYGRRSGNEFLDHFLALDYRRLCAGGSLPRGRTDERGAGLNGLMLYRLKQ